MAVAWSRRYNREKERRKNRARLSRDCCYQGNWKAWEKQRGECNCIMEYWQFDSLKLKLGAAFDISRESDKGKDKGEREREFKNWRATNGEFKKKKEINHLTNNPDFKEETGVGGSDPSVSRRGKRFSAGTGIPLRLRKRSRLHSDEQCISSRLNALPDDKDGNRRWNSCRAARKEKKISRPPALQPRFQLKSMRTRKERETWREGWKREKDGTSTLTKRRQYFLARVRVSIIRKLMTPSRYDIWRHQILKFGAKTWIERDEIFISLLLFNHASNGLVVARSRFWKNCYLFHSLLVIFDLLCERMSLKIKWNYVSMCIIFIVKIVIILLTFK